MDHGYISKTQTSMTLCDFYIILFFFFLTDNHMIQKGNPIKISLCISKCIHVHLIF